MSFKRPTNPVILHRQNIEKLPLETFENGIAGGNVSWRTLISAPKTNTDTFTVGVAVCPAGSSIACPTSELKITSGFEASVTAAGHLKPHRHAHAELYHITSGKGVVTIDGEETEVSKGSVVYIPGDAEHGIRNTGREELEWLYVFAAKGFEEIMYRFSGEKAKL